MRRIRLIVCLVLVLSLSVPVVTRASLIGDAIKVGGIGLVVSKFGTQINSAINKLTFQKGASSQYATKVVPVISIGDGKQIGAVQVTGSESLVGRTKAVLQLEGRVFGSVRLRALIPSDTTNPFKFSRVQGVGVSALIDINI